MKRKNKSEDYIYNIIKNTYKQYGYNATFIAIQQAIYYGNFENFVNDHHEIDKLLKYLNVGYEEFTKKYRQNGAFLFNLCESYVNIARSNPKKTIKTNPLERIVSNKDVIQENMAYSLFTKLFNVTFLEEQEILEKSMDRNLKRYRRGEDYEELANNLLADMYTTFSCEIKKDLLLDKVKEKSFYRNTAQNLRMIFSRKNKRIISGVKDSDNYKKLIPKKRYKVDKRYEVHQDVGKNLHAVSTIGKKRENQEDTAIIMEHPDNPNLKLFAVCDGAGGYDKGEIASFYLAKKLEEWFLNDAQSLNDIKDEKELNKIIRTKLKQINAEGFRAINGDNSIEYPPVTTMVCAMKLEGRTKIISIGDSRGYIVKKGELMQITKDESYVNMVYDGAEKEVKQHLSENDLRFARKSNMILNSFFSEEKGLDIRKITTIGNDEYDKIILCSDGVSDCMSNEEIAYFSKNVKGKRLADFLVQAANINESLLPTYLRHPNKAVKENFTFYNKIEPSKDNSTVIVYENEHQEEKDGFEER